MSDVEKYGLFALVFVVVVLCLAWLLDPTGVVTDRLARLSEVPGWSPIEMFDEARHYRVQESPRAGAVAQR